MNPEALDADCAALAAAGSLAEEALALHRDALAILEQGWHSQSGSAATDALRRQCGQAAELVTALHDATGEFRQLRDAAEAGMPAPADQFSTRLSDRLPAQFEAAQPVPFGNTAAPAPPPAAAWTPGPAWTPAAAGPQFPDLGSTLVGLVAQIADTLNLAPAEEAGEAVQRGSAPPTEAPTEAPPAPPSPPVHAAGPPAQPDPVLAPSPLLAAERPPDPPEPAPEPRPDPAPGPEIPAVPVAPVPEPAPPEDPQTPCEIAADALPQVGQ